MQVGKYQLLHKLATGGMAEVFLARAAGPMGFEKLVVLKRILPHLASERPFVEMFLSEARLAAQLNHPSIVQIFDFGEAEGAYFLAMEYIDGPNLREVLTRAGGLGLALPVALCARVIASACEGLTFAHNFWDPVTGQPLNIIHRDISPDNILLSKQGAVKVVDFGIAKAAGTSPHTQTGVLKGKLAYMPPEQLRNEPLDRRTDVYSLGVVLYELLTGQKPFTANSEAGMVQAILFEAQAPVTHHRVDVPELVQRILGRALAKERERRYPDCATFQGELEEFILSTGKQMGATQLAQFACMMSNMDAGSPALQPLSALRSSLRAAVEPEVTPTKPPVGEVTSAARPSRLAVKAIQEAHGAPAPEEKPPPVPPLASAPRGLRVPPWAAVVGGGLLLVGGGYVGTRLPPRSASTSSQGSTPAEVIPPPIPVPQEPLDAGVEVELPPPSHPPSPSPSPSPPPRPRQAPSKGTLEIHTEPGVHVFLDKFQMGKSPLRPIELEPKVYQVRLVHPRTKKEVTREVEISAGETVVLQASLREAKGGSPPAR